MGINTPISPPTSIVDRVTAVLTQLSLPVADQQLRARVQTFIHCNGFYGVQQAITYTAAQVRQQGSAINDPWAYAVRVYNDNLSRLSYLYTLSHWVESGLRSQVDHYYSATLGTTWHADPSKYLGGR